jgi:hypothetical protein
MSIKFCINELSLSCQLDDHEIVVVVRELINCLDILRPLHQEKAVHVHYNPAMLSQTLGSGTFAAQMGRHCGVQDRTRWQLIRQNMLRKVVPDTSTVTVASCTDSTLTDCGDVSVTQAQPGVTWLSMAIKSIYRHPRLAVGSSVRGTFEILNLSTPVNVEGHFPGYEANPKHRKEAYQFNGEHISEMNLDGPRAWAALVVSEGDDANRFALVAGTYYRFRCHGTNNGRRLYHGHVCDEGDIPNHLLGLLSDLHGRQDSAP